MVYKGKVVKVRMGHKDHGKICGSETNIGMPCCNQAGTTLHVMAYLDDLLVSRTPLLMGLCCQAPIRTGIEEVKYLLVIAQSVTPCMLPCDTPGSEEMTNLTTQQLWTAKSRCCCCAIQ